MTEEERSTYYYENPDAIDDDFDGDSPIESAPASNLGVNTSVRFTIEEHRALRAAAAGSAMNISEWIRAACAEAVERANDPEYQELRSAFARIQQDVRYAHDLSTRAAMRHARRPSTKNSPESGTGARSGATKDGQ